MHPVSIQRKGQVEILPNDQVSAILPAHLKSIRLSFSQGNRITPSYVAFVPESGERLVGDAAKNQAPQNVGVCFLSFRNRAHVTLKPTNTVFDAKRMLGRTFDDADVQRDM